MATVKLNRTSAQFWKMTPRETAVLITEHNKQDGERMKWEAKLTGVACVSYDRGIEPFKDETKKPVKIVVDNDAGFAGL